MNDNDPMGPAERNLYNFISNAVVEARARALRRQQNVEWQKLIKAYLRGLSRIVGSAKTIALGIFVFASIRFCWDAWSNLSLGSLTVGFLLLAISLLAAVDTAERTIGRWEWRPKSGSPLHYHFAVGMRAKRMSKLANPGIVQ
ncbi:hypothetical protein [Novosphingobium beihaiensis]|uniref:SMODS and SLOG-associating 2TM effector domain-containing protein n=1 Tax=Novosphingobium beihaiensis TaxID=2930389 RepID=A0ABT0BW63_9SPHN|nr:hypothetical protein [Novosphingobium beihaiensis]MCJ2189225.1 hypothetical protein [Novosphingobium beihaiensis]